MKKVSTLFVSLGLIGGLSQFGLAGTHGQLDLAGNAFGGDNLGFGDARSNLYIGLFDAFFIPDPSGPATPHFQTYCTDYSLHAELAPPTVGVTEETTTSFVQDPTSTHTQSNAMVGSEIAWLVNNFGNTTVADHAAALQLAIWDLSLGGTGLATDSIFSAVGTIVFFQQAGTHNLAESNAIKASGESFAALAYNGGAGRSSVATWFKADLDRNGQPVSQDWVTPSGTPEPFTMALGIAGIGMAVRRRARR